MTNMTYSQRLHLLSAAIATVTFAISAGRPTRLPCKGNEGSVPRIPLAASGMIENCSAGAQRRQIVSGQLKNVRFS